MNTKAFAALTISLVTLFTFADRTANQTWTMEKINEGKSVILDDIAVKMIGDATNDLAKTRLPSWLTASTEEPRGKTDLDVHDRKWVFSGPAVDAGNQYRLEINYYEPSGRYDVDLYRVGFDEIVDHRDSDTPDIKHVDMADTYLGLGVVGDLLDVKTPSKLAHTSATSGLAKLGAGGELTAATPSSTGGADADYRDSKDAKCYETEFTEWDHTEDHPWRLTYDGNNIWNLRHDTGQGYYTEASYSGGEYATTITWTGGESGLPDELHRQRIATKDEPFVTQSFVTEIVSNQMPYKMSDIVNDVISIRTFNRLLVTNSNPHKITFPSGSENISREFAIRIEIGPGNYTPNVTFPSPPSAIYEGDNFPDITPDVTKDKVWIVFFKETKKNTWYVRVNELNISTVPYSVNNGH